MYKNVVFIMKSVPTKIVGCGLLTFDWNFPNIFNRRPFLKIPRKEFIVEPLVKKQAVAVQCMKNKNI